MSEQLYSAKYILHVIRSISTHFLNSQQFDLKIFEEEANGDSTYYKVSMSDFLTKMVAAELVESGASATGVTWALKEMEASPITFPSGKSVSLIAYSPVYISDGRSKIRAER